MVCARRFRRLRDISTLTRKVRGVAGCFALLSAVVPSVAVANGFHTAHQFAVSESGAAAITVPIQVPRGIGGMEPQLALSYSSGSGNGLLGLGWTLSGPSAITRCAKSEELDGQRGAVAFVKGDRYCLDGQRLVMVGPSASSDDTYGVNGSEYRTERESFSRVTAYGPFSASQPTVPLRFTVETKAGLTLEFGLSANTRVLTNFVSGVSTPATVNRWLLQRISDKHGSFVEFVYCSGELSADSATCGTAA
jgi:Salmonella virulence plasmid 65kDa B protein